MAPAWLLISPDEEWKGVFPEVGRNPSGIVGIASYRKSSVNSKMGQFNIFKHYESLWGNESGKKKLDIDLGTEWSYITDKRECLLHKTGVVLIDVTAHIGCQGR